jgi:hypothetical protein
MVPLIVLVLIICRLHAIGNFVFETPQLVVGVEHEYDYKVQSDECDYQVQSEVDYNTIRGHHAADLHTIQETITMLESPPSTVQVLHPLPALLL